MTMSSLNLTDGDRELVRRLNLGGATAVELNRLTCVLERAHAVGVLDTFRREGGGYLQSLRSHNEHGERAAHGGSYVQIALMRSSRGPLTRSFWSTTDEPGMAEDEVRAAAAKAIESGEV